MQRNDTNGAMETQIFLSRRRSRNRLARRERVRRTTKSRGCFPLVHLLGLNAHAPRVGICKMASFMSVGAGANVGRVKRWIGTLPGRSKWTDDATVNVLRIIEELNVVPLLQCKRQRNQRTFMTVEEYLSRVGYSMSWQQIRCHWKNLKTRYYHVGIVVMPQTLFLLPYTTLAHRINIFVVYSCLR